MEVESEQLFQRRMKGQALQGRLNAFFSTKCVTTGLRFSIGKIQVFMKVVSTILLRSKISKVIGTCKHFAAAEEESDVPE